MFVFCRSTLRLEEIGTNAPVEVALVGDARAVVGQLNRALEQSPWSFATDAAWRGQLEQGGAKNRALVEHMTEGEVDPMGYYRVLSEIRDRLPGNVLIVSEGANTMDISRTVLPNHEPRTRLDAGTFGTMGVGMGFAIAAAAVHPERKVVAIEGDSAFGFSGMEVEVACRYRLPITFIVINNNGISSGRQLVSRGQADSAVGLHGRAHYERVIEAFGGRGSSSRSSASWGQRWTRRSPSRSHRWSTS